MIIPSSPPQAKERRISSSRFWPDIEPTAIRLQQRIDNTIPPERLRTALIESIASVNNALLQWRQTHEASGVESLEEIQAEEIDGTSIHVHRYQRAVGCLAKALLLERLRDFDATGKGERKAEFLTDPIDDCRRDHLAAIADIVGRNRITVELI
jgi:hypothetical protein